MTDHDKQTTLDARLVIGGLWRGAAVRATKHTGQVVDGVVVERIASGTGWRVCGPGIVEAIAHDEAPTVWALELLLPGEDGGNLHRLEKRCKARTKRWVDQQDKSEPSPLPDWFNDAVEAIGDDAEAFWPWCSRYLSMIDALAAKLGWPTGKGAPVYGWGWIGLEWLLTSPGHLAQAYQGDSITDPMVALETVWRRECAR